MNLEWYSVIERTIMKEKRTRLNVDLDPELHKKLKILAAKRNITIAKLVAIALNKHVKWEEKYE